MSKNSPKNRRAIKDFSNTNSIDASFQEFQSDPSSNKKRRKSNADLNVSLNSSFSNNKENSTNKDKSDIPQFSTQELYRHYEDCLKLSAENKINSKNAFQLHLISYMSEMMKNYGQDSFQKAGMLLDAGTKIYAARVDRLQSDVLKMATSLAQGDSAKQGDEEESEEAADVDEDGMETEQAAAPKKKEKRKKGKKPIAKNPATITRTLSKKKKKKYEEENRFEALMELSENFNESVALLRSQVVEWTKTSPLTEEDLTRKHPDMNLSLLSHCFNQAQDARLLPTLSVVLEQEELSDSVMNHSFQNNGQRLSAHDQSLDAFDNAGFEGDDDDADARSDSERNSHISDDQAIDHEISVANATHIDEMIRQIRADVSIYEKMQKNMYDFTRLGKATAFKRLEAMERNAATKKERRKRGRKAIDYDAELNLSFLKKPGRHKMTSKDFEKRAEMAASFFATEEQPPNEFFTLSIQLNVMSRSKEEKKAAEIQQQQEAQAQVDNEDDNVPPIETDAYDDDVSFTSQPEGDMPDDMPMITGQLELVQAPHQVEKIDIAYSRTAKRLNVKRVKYGMWKILTRETTTHSRHDDSRTGSNSNVDETSFCQMIHNLPKYVDQQTAKNLSPAIALNCLLHLTNEKILRLSNPTYTFSEIVICQGEEEKDSL